MLKIKKPRQPGPWGIWDDMDKFWVGNKEGPLKYTDHRLARAALTVLTEMQGQYRYRLKTFPVPPLVNTGTFKTKMTGAQAIQKIERKKK